jgi:hypothetical protein
VISFGVATLMVVLGARSSPSAGKAIAWTAPAGIHKIKHVIVVMQENRSFDSYAKFIEDDFLGGQRLDPQTDGRADPRPDVREALPILGNLVNDFDFTQTPRRPLILPTAPTARHGGRGGRDRCPTGPCRRSAARAPGLRHTALR